MTKPTTESIVQVITELMKAVSKEDVDIMVLIDDEEDITVVSNACIACMAETFAEYLKERNFKHIADTGTRTH
jgi:hypothetical protein